MPQRTTRRKKKTEGGIFPLLPLLAPALIGAIGTLVGHAGTKVIDKIAGNGVPRRTRRAKATR
jgi:hypothetical protein